MMFVYLWFFCGYQMRGEDNNLASSLRLDNKYCWCWHWISVVDCSFVLVISLQSRNAHCILQDTCCSETETCLVTDEWMNLMSLKTTSWTPITLDTLHDPILCCTCLELDSSASLQEIELIHNHFIPSNRCMK